MSRAAVGCDNGRIRCDQRYAALKFAIGSRIPGDDISGHPITATHRIDRPPIMGSNPPTSSCVASARFKYVPSGGDRFVVVEPVRHACKCVTSASASSGSSTRRDPNRSDNARNERRYAPSIWSQSTRRARRPESINDRSRESASDGGSQVTLNTYEVSNRWPALAYAARRSSSISAAALHGNSDTGYGAAGRRTASKCQHQSSPYANNASFTVRDNAARSASVAAVTSGPRYANADKSAPSFWRITPSSTMNAQLRRSATPWGEERCSASIGMRWVVVAVAERPEIERDQGDRHHMNANDGHETEADSTLGDRYRGLDTGEQHRPMQRRMNDRHDGRPHSVAPANWSNPTICTAPNMSAMAKIAWPIRRAPSSCR